MNTKDRSVLTLDRLIEIQGEEVRRRGIEDGKVRTLMDLSSASEFDALGDYTLFQRSKFPPFPGWGD